VLNLELILDHTDDVAKRLATKGLDPAKVYSARDSVVHRRRVRTKLDELRSQMNQRSKELGRLVAAKDPAADALRTKTGRAQKAHRGTRRRAPGCRRGVPETARGAAQPA
jgi:seryl-tRNA synthetase